MLWAYVLLSRAHHRVASGYDNRIKTIAKEHPKQESGNRMDTGKGKEPESAIDELIKGMRDLQLKFTKLEKGERSGVTEAQ